MTEDKFYEVFEWLQDKSSSAYRSLYNAMNEERILSVIVDGDKYWTERNSCSQGLSDAQHATLKKIMQKQFNKVWLYAD